MICNHEIENLGPKMNLKMLSALPDAVIHHAHPCRSEEGCLFVGWLVKIIFEQHQHSGRRYAQKTFRQYLYWHLSGPSDRAQRHQLLLLFRVRYLEGVRQAHKLNRVSAEYRLYW